MERRFLVREPLRHSERVKRSPGILLPPPYKCLLASVFPILGECLRRGAQCGGAMLKVNGMRCQRIPIQFFFQIVTQPIGLFLQHCSPRHQVGNIRPHTTSAFNGFVEGRLHIRIQGANRINRHRTLQDERDFMFLGFQESNRDNVFLARRIDQPCNISVYSAFFNRSHPGLAQS